MIYARISKHPLRLQIVEKKTGDAWHIKLSSGICLRSRNVMSDRILRHVIYPDVYARNRTNRIRVKYSLAPVDPWLTALGQLMWEGIVQGLTWEVVRRAVIDGRDRMRALGVAPPRRPKAVGKRESSTEFGFSWTDYSDGRTLRHVFVGLRRGIAAEREKSRPTRVNRNARRKRMRPSNRREAAS